MYFPLFLSLFWYALLCAIHLEEEERAGCFAFIVIRMSCCCKCAVTLPHCVMCWSAVYDCVLTFFIKTFLSPRVASGSDKTSCNNIAKPLVVYIFRYVMWFMIIMLHKRSQNL